MTERDKVKAQNPDASSSQLMSKLAEAWKNASDQVKEHYNHLASLDKTEVAEKVAQIKADTPEVPKRPKNAYLIFVADAREKIVAQNPDLNSKQILSKLADEWRNISSDKRDYYTKLADDEKEKYIKIKHPSSENSQ